MDHPVIPDGFEREQPVPVIPDGFEIETKSEDPTLNSVNKNLMDGAIETTQNIGRVYPALETVASVLTQTYGMPATGLAGVVGLAAGKAKNILANVGNQAELADAFGQGAEVIETPEKTSERYMDAVSKLTIYEPQTERGKQLLTAAFLPFEKLTEGGEVAGDWVLEKTGNASLAALTKTGIEASPMALMAFMGRAGRIKKAAAPKQVTPESQFIKEQFDSNFLEKEGIKPFNKSAEVVELQKPFKSASESAAIFENNFRTRQPVKGKENLKLMLAEEEIVGKSPSGRSGMTPKQQAELRKLKAVELTPEESFILEADGMPGLKKASDTRVAETATEGALKPIDNNGVTLYGGIPIQQFMDAYTKKIGEPLWDKLIMQKTPQLLSKIPGGKAVNRALIYDWRGDLPDTPKFMRSLEDMKQHQSIGREYAIDLGTRLEAMPESIKLKMGSNLRGGKSSLPEIFKPLESEARTALDSLGKQAVDVGLLGEKVFFENIGKYFPRFYTSKEYMGNLTRFGVSEPTKLDLSRFRKRKDIPKEIRKEMGEILTPGYPVAKAVTQLTHDIEMAKHFNGIAANPEWSLPKITDSQIPATWKQLPNNRKYGKLSESHVHPEIFSELTEAVRVRSQGEKVWRKALGAWKFGKVILSPKTHARNILSNSLLAHLGGLDMTRQPRMLTKAAKEMRNKGSLWKSAKGEGLISNTFTEAELKQLFDNIDGNLGSIRAGSLPEKFGLVGQSWSKAKLGANKAAKLYNAEEVWFKMAKFIDNVETKGMSKKLAAIDAEKWLFNYSKLTKAQEAYRTKWYGAPFATFTIKAIPRIAEAVIKTPWRFATPAAMIYGLEEAARNMIGDTKQEAASKKTMRPDWMQGNFIGIPNFPRVPVVDDKGREYYLNLSYIVPWGDIAESGGMGPIPGGLMPLSMPFTKEAWQQLAGSGNLLDEGGYDNFWKEPIVKPEDVAGLSTSERIKTVAKKRGRHLYNTVVPTIAMDIEKGIDAISGNPDYRGRTRPGGVVLADTVGGIKMYPVDYNEQVIRQIGKIDPTRSTVARRIRANIRTLSVKRNYFAQNGNDKKVKAIDLQIARKITQLQGLGKEVAEVGEEFKKTKGE